MSISKGAVLLVVVALSSIQIAQASLQASYLSNSLADCQSLQDLFKYTVSSRSDLALSQQYPYDTTGGQKAIDYELVTCNFPGQCPDGVTRNTCKWKRVLIFECASGTQGELDGDVTAFSVGTNSLPDHCYYSTDNAPIGSDQAKEGYVFGGVFNLPVKLMSDYDSVPVDQQFYYSEIKTQTQLDTFLCDDKWAKTETLDKHIYPKELTETIANGTLGWEEGVPVSNYLRLPDSSNVVGVTLNGVFLFGGTSDYGYDAFFPKAWGKKQNPKAIEVDICLGTARTYNTYRYHMFSPCIYESNLTTVAESCEDNIVCQTDVRAHSIAYVPKQLQTLTPIGIAKDGRVIYGPFRTDGNLWQPCDVDVCNGRMFGQYYGYVATMFHPYFVGCWGPGTRPVNKMQSCSSNGRQCSGAINLFQSTILVILIFATSILSL